VSRYLWIIILFFLCSACFAEKVIFKSGNIIEGNIIEETENYIKIETEDGKPLYFYKNAIEAIKYDNGESLSEIAAEQISLRTGLLDCSDKGYMLFIPKNISSARPLSILVCLPGWGIAAKQDIHVWTFPAQKNRLVVINLDVNYNSIKSASEVKSLYYRIMQIIDGLSETYPIDTRKIYIAGTSAGGMASIALALQFPGKFLAIGVVSGGRLGFGAKSYLRNANGKYFYMVHGQQDRSIPIGEFYSTKQQLERNGAIIEFSVFPEGAHTLPSRAYAEVIDWLLKVKN